MNAAQRLRDRTAQAKNQQLSEDNLLHFNYIYDQCTVGAEQGIGELEFNAIPSEVREVLELYGFNVTPKTERRPQDKTSTVIGYRVSWNRA